MRIICETARLRLREMTESDRPFLLQLLSNPNVMQFYPHPLSSGEVGEWLARQQRRYQTDGHGLWLVEDHNSGESLGQVGLVRQQLGEESLVELGYMINQPHWRKGIAREAGQACLDYGFQRMKLPEISSLIRPENVASQKTAKSLGMRRAEQVTFHKATHWRYRIRPDA